MQSLFNVGRSVGCSVRCFVGCSVRRSVIVDVMLDVLLFIRSGSKLQVLFDDRKLLNGEPFVRGRVR